VPIVVFPDPATPITTTIIRVPVIGRHALRCARPQVW
jgi:hypothetical protein